jgi:hypothetical protein
MSATIADVVKAIKAAVNESKGPPVTVYMMGAPKCGKTYCVNTLKAGCTAAGLRVVIVEQNPNCNKTYIDLSRSLEQAFRSKKDPAETKLDNEISAISIELSKLSNKLNTDNTDTEQYEELSQTQIDLNTKLVAIKNIRTELKSNRTGTPDYVYDVVLLDRTQVAKSHRNTITKIYSELFNKEYPETKCIGINMITSLDTCIARIPKNRSYDHCVKFTTDLYEQYEPMSTDQGYAYVFDIDGVTPNTTELKTIKPNKPKQQQHRHVSTGGGNAWSTKPLTLTPTTPTTQTTPTVEEDNTPFESSDPAPEESPDTEEIKMMGFVLGLSVTQRTGILAMLNELKKKGIMDKKKTLIHPIKYCNGISCRRTTKELTIKSFKNVPMPGTKIAVTFDAYVCDDNLGCLTARLEDTVNFVSGRTFMPVDLALGNNGNASKMLDTKSGTRYPIDPITVEMTVGLQIRNPDHTISTIYDSRVLGPNMFKLLSQ